MPRVTIAELTGRINRLKEENNQLRKELYDRDNAEEPVAPVTITTSDMVDALIGELLQLEVVVTVMNRRWLNIREESYRAFEALPRDFNMASSARVASPSLAQLLEGFHSVGKELARISYLLRRSEQFPDLVPKLR